MVFVHFPPFIWHSVLLAFSILSSQSINFTQISKKLQNKTPFTNNLKIKCKQHTDRISVNNLNKQNKIIIQYQKRKCKPKKIK